MVRKGNFSGRNLALTILIGVFISVMVATLFNLVVSFAYPAPEYNDFCEAGRFLGPVIDKPLQIGESCTFSRELREAEQQCFAEEGTPIYEYDNRGCQIAVKQCDFCNKEFSESIARYNRNAFFIFALIGFALIVSGLFIPNLLIQIITLPAGAFLVIEAAVKNFDDKLYVIITFSLLIIAAIYLALKKIR